VWDRGGEQPPAAPLPFRVGDDVIHATFGEGVVTGIQRGGIVTVNFAAGAGERQLMADYAPLRRR
jgi:DNA helicase-2/ATP-dependent DNA helicase PcrA